ncbi:CHAT domain-containing protein [Rhizobium leguminosarum]|uniref:CHAT domain-containing protein n=1 Tax=Rhizobium leguminosarum TaxID=384 RepID=A0AAJ1AC73_RHILE|nr:CHAT domain-containing protein [Rhizobium leguminosarum]MBY5533808.1 CHAT domain-containing protein [Rhizobium leguminosarum]MBY5594896.1 CHAT domain-containing protein [Rhizobium leguminosarum]MBY5630921.1 CHAT domain-containing protein [Rhizobium leguminosarum]MBY5652654.1 CHAT domain-containing protein [Rhizobium leguminosarum]
MKILCIASQAPEAESLAVAREIMDLQQLADSSNETLKSIFLPDITLEELQIALTKHKPDILHIAVHGSEAGLWFSKEASDGRTRELANVSGRELANFLDPDNPPKLIFLNACQSSKIATALTERGFLAIGTTAPTTNRAAIAATRLLYNRIPQGRLISEAFAAMNDLVACLQVKKLALNLACRLPIPPRNRCSVSQSSSRASTTRSRSRMVRQSPAILGWLELPPTRSRSYFSPTTTASSR